MTIAGLVMLLVVLGSAVPLMFGLAALRGASLETRGALTVLGFAVLTLGWPIMVTLMTGNNDMLDAGRFALYPVRTRQLLPGLLVAAAMGLGGLLTVFMGVGYVVAWSGSLVTFVLAVVGLVLGFATCLVSSRALSAALASLLRRRRARDMVTILVVLIILLLSTGIQFVSHAIPANTGVAGGTSLSEIWQSIVAGLQPIAGVAAWTPFGWAWSLPWAAGQGHWGTVGLWGVLAIAWVAFLSWAWMHYFAASLVSPLEAGGTAEKIAKANPLDRLLPDTPAGGVAKRSLRYWRRDPRRLIGAIATILVPFMMGVAIYAGEGSSTGSDLAMMKAVMAFSPCMMGFMASIAVSMDISYDGTALATQIVTGVSGRDDRWGRMVAYLIIFVPIQVVMIVIFMAISGRWDLIVPVTGLCAGWLLAGSGIGSWLGAVFQIPQPPAGSNLVNRNTAGGIAGFASAMIGIFLPMMVVLPTIGCAVAAVAFGGVWNWLTLLVGVATGWLLLWWGMRAGGRRLDKTWPEVLARVTWKG